MNLKMSKVLKMRLPDCDNQYTAEDLYDRFGMYDEEVTICLSCKKHCIESGIITCEYIRNNLSSTIDRGE